MGLTAARVVSLTHSICLSFSWVFLLGCSVTAPAFKSSGFMSYYNQYHTYYFGVFGYCNNYAHYCKTQVGYSIYGLFRQAQGESGSSEALNITYSYLTKYLLLIPVACVITFTAWVVTMRQSRRGKILFSSAIGCFIAFSFSLASLVMEELLFRQLYNDSQQVPRSTVRWGSARYALMVAVVATFVATITGVLAAINTRKEANSRGVNPVAFEALPLQPYDNMDKQDQAGLLAHSAPPGRSGSPGPFDNPYERGGRLSYDRPPSPMYEDRPAPYADHPEPYDPHRPHSPPGPVMYEDPYASNKGNH